MLQPQQWLALCLFFASSVLILSATPAPINDAPLPPLEAFFSDPTRFAECLSPDGERVAFLGPDCAGTNRLWVTKIDQGAITLRVSPEEGPAVIALFWINSDAILWQTRDSAGKTHLFTGSPRATDIREILPYERRCISLEGVVGSATPCILVGLSDEPTAYPDLYRVNLSSTHPPIRVCQNRHRIITWAWDKEGTPVAGLRWMTDGAKEIVNLRDDFASVVLKVAPADDARILFATGDGSQLFVITNQNSDLTYLARIELATGKLEKVATDPRGRVDVEQVVADPVADAILAVGYAGETTRWQAIDPSFSKMLEALNRLPKSRGLLWLGMDESKHRFLLKCVGDKDPGTVFCYNTATNSLQMLWAERPEIDLEALCESAAIEYTSRDGTPIPAYLTVPCNGKPPWPMVVFPHGGPRMRSHPGFDSRVQFLASRGYAVLQPNFRGSRGYGKAFMNAGDGQWGRGFMQTDVTDGVEHLIRTGTADSRRVAILGGSYGGYAALAGLAFTPDVYAAGVCLFGISDLLAYATNSPVEWEAFAGDQVRRVGDPGSSAGRSQLNRCSPVHHANSFKAPLLIYHGANDPLIPVSHARRMVAALERNAKPVDYLLSSSEGHGFSHPESEMAVYRAIEIFLHKHLGGKLGPEPTAPISRKLTAFQCDGKADSSQ
jgi:dipeptidyl aminopeptidase/acylaminoacyl peptidase